MELAGRVGFLVLLEQAVEAAAAVLLGLTEEVLPPLLAHTEMAGPVALTVAVAHALAPAIFIVGVA